MTNGARPDYVNSFMSFLESRGESSSTTTTGENVANKPVPKGLDDIIQDDNEEADIRRDEVSSTAVENEPPAEDVTPTDHTPADRSPATDQPVTDSTASSEDPPPESIPNNDQQSDSTPANEESRAESTQANEQPPADSNPATDHPSEDSTSALEQHSEDSVPSSEDHSRSGTVPSSGKRNVARRGRRHGASSGHPDDSAPQRDTPRRSARTVQRYGHIDFLESDGYGDSDPDFHLTDSDDDPDFNPLNKKENLSDEDEFKPVKRGRGRPRGSGGRGGLGRGVKRALDSSKSKSAELSSNEDKPTSTSGNSSNPPKRRGRPPTYSQSSPTNTPTSGDDETVSSTDDKKSPSKLSSAYNYAVRTQRNNQNIRLPEGPQLTPEQLEMVESQFKSGDFVMAKKDMDMMEHPPIWRIDGKSLLQKFQAFEKDGKTLYRNISTYSGWTSQAKALYIRVKVTFVFQSRYDTVVELHGVSGSEEEEPEKEKGEDDDKPSWSAVKYQQQDFEISEELRSHMPSFEIYLQTLISQALDNNFLMEIYEENDEYFVERVKVIDELAEQRKRKVLEIVQWNDQFRSSLDTWPCINVMLTKNAGQCQACSKYTASKLSQLYGQPYDQQTLRSREPMPSEIDTKNFEVCERCSNISQMYNKVSHQKYDYYSQCKSTVTNMRVTHPSKHTTTILRDLLANDHWIMGLFRSMCTTWIKVDRMYQEETERLTKNASDST